MNNINEFISLDELENESLFQVEDDDCYYIKLKLFVTPEALSRNSHRTMLYGAYNINNKMLYTFHRHTKVKPIKGKIEVIL